MSAADSDELLAIALDAAAQAGELLLSMRPDRALDRAAFAETKSSRTDLVTGADRASEQLILETILAARPDDGIVGEEGSARPSRSGVTWVIDPLDGTTNYVYGFPVWAVSIAAATEHETLVGVVHDPSRSEVFSATRGGGANLNGAALTVAAQGPALAEALIGTGFSYFAARRALQGALVAELLPQVRDIRRAGAAALDLCAVAAGRLDGYYEADLKPWDLAAGALICTESGARVHLLEGVLDVPNVVAAHPAVHGALTEALTVAAAVIATMRATREAG